jgi:predicted GIY-YIG superfamily endonuclease
MRNKNIRSLSVTKDVVDILKRTQFYFGESGRVSKTYWVRALYIINLISEENQKNCFVFPKNEILRDAVYDSSALNSMLETIKSIGIVDIVKKTHVNYIINKKYVGRLEILLTKPEERIFSNIDSKKYKNRVRTNPKPQKPSKKRLKKCKDVSEYIFPIKSNEKTKHILYKFFNKDELLYIGITNNTSNRTNQHLSEKDWMSDYEEIKITLTFFNSRKELELAEKLTIIYNNPKYNKIRYVEFEKEVNASVTKKMMKYEENFKTETMEEIKTSGNISEPWTYIKEIKTKKQKIVKQNTQIQSAGKKTRNKPTEIKILPNGSYSCSAKNNPRYSANTWKKGGKEYWRCKKDGNTITKLKTHMTEEQFLEYVRNYNGKESQ